MQQLGKMMLASRVRDGINMDCRVLIKEVMREC